MTTAELKKTANEVRKDIIKATHAAKSGHPGGSLSAADVFTYLYFVEMNIDPENPKTEIVLFYPRDMWLLDITQHLQREDTSRKKIFSH